MRKIILGLLTIGTLSLLTAEMNLGACKGCHGQTFEKKALGKSLVVSDMNATEISAALLGYKEGTYNSAGMAGLMKGQVAKYSDEELLLASEKIFNSHSKK